MYKPALTFASRVLATLALLTVLSAAAQAQDRYRAEIVVLERLADPLIQENMAGKMPGRAESSKRLWVVDSAGNRASDLDTTSNLTLNNAAARLESSGKYRVLMKTGWIESFPNNYNGEPLTIELGDFLEAAGHRSIEGTIEINRRRYLLVTVALNHWREATGDNRVETIEDSGDGDTRNGGDQDPGSAPVTADENDTAAISPSVQSAAADKELVTWIRETRRMRSKEIHFVDSPTIGVLIYFRPVD
ncbi:CsiV family protein [Marinobacter sp.]|uniref:CsiV family protein n=1 Tax=Marinobacter sp. TaxID=50741 RepID=UPI00356599B9